MPVPPVPQTGRPPADLNDPALRAALRQRHAQDEGDMFASDPHPTVRVLGRVALRRAHTNEAVRDLLAVGDACARLTRTPDGRLRVFYVGKTLTAYRSAVTLADARGQWDDGADARRALDAFIAWIVACADDAPHRRNIAVALWAAAEYDEALSHTPSAPRPQIGSSDSSDGADETRKTALVEALATLEVDARVTLEALAVRDASPEVWLSGDTLSDSDGVTFSDVPLSLTLDSSGELEAAFAPVTPPRAFSDLGDQIARLYLNNRSFDEVISSLLVRYNGGRALETRDWLSNSGDVSIDLDTPMDAPLHDPHASPVPDAAPDPRRTLITTSALYANPALVETQTRETPIVPPPPRRPRSKTAPDGESWDAEPSSSTSHNLDKTQAAFLDAPPLGSTVYDSRGTEIAASETRHDSNLQDWLPSVDSGIDALEWEAASDAHDFPPRDEARASDPLMEGWHPEGEGNAGRGAPPAPLPSSDPIADEFPPGALIDHRYEVSNVKRGGMGVVYLCYDHQRREAVALKSFQARFLNNERARARFGQEAWTWVRLEKHRHIVKALLVQNIEDRPYLILEHVSGPEGLEADLRSWIERKRLTLATSLKFALHIALGMRHATQKVPGLVHRDLKPANILVTHDEIAKVTDFGLVRSLEDEQYGSDPDLINGSGTPSSSGSPSGDDPRVGSGSTSAPTMIHDERLTKFGALVGTLPYMSPEQCQAMDVDQRADIYAFGCLLYEMLTGAHIFPARKKEAWLHAHIHERPVFPPHSAATLPQTLQTLVMMCLEKHPEDRPSSWSVLVESLAALYETILGVPPVLDVSGTELEARELMDKAYSLTELGRGAEALIAYDRALALQPKNAWAWARKARALRLLHRYDEARATYDHALRLDPSYAWALKGKGIVLERLGDLNGALSAHQRAAQLDPTDVWHWHNQGDIYQKLGRYGEAIAVLEEALRVDPQHTNSWAKLGQVLRLMRHYEQALAAYERALSLDPKYAWAHNGYGLTLKALGDYERAVNSFRLATRFDPRVVWHWYNVTEMLVELRHYEDALPTAREAVRISPDQASVWGKLGQVLRYLKRYDEALTTYERAIQLQPTFAWAHNGKGIIYEQMGRYDDALACYQLATHYGPGDPSHWYNQGNALTLLGQHDAAISHLERAVQLKPAFARAWARLGGTRRQLRQLGPAVEALHTATTLDPSNAWAWSELARALTALGRHDEATHARRRAAESKPDQAIFLTQHADALLNRGDYDEALDVLDQALKLDGRNARAWARRGQVLRRLGRHGDALRSYQRALDLDPRYAWAWGGRAMAELALNAVDEALESLKRAIECDPLDVWYRYTLGDTLVALDRFQDAVAVLTAAARIDPAHSDVWAKLGQAYRRLGQHTDALHAYDKALAIKPDHAWAWNGRGLSLEKLRRDSEAISSYRRALALDQSVIWYYTNLVDLLLMQRQHDAALELMDMALSALPDSPIAWARHGQVLRRTGAYDDAIHSYQRALQLDPSYAWAWNGMGLAHAALGQWQQAIPAYTEAVRLNTHDVWFWYNFGDALLMVSDIAGAITMFERALTLDAKHEPSLKKLKQARDQSGE
jgi:tetratricopeptide (TPR) repeat protein/tRNA A-37 threonylcarbamoyl transferase component Bud32